MDRFRSAEHAFTVDPVDGTKNFVHGSPDHAMMIAEVKGGDVVRGWIWQPQHEVAYVAERGAGAFRNGERLRRPPLGDSLRGVTSRRKWLGRALGTLSSMELTWVCCGVDYPKVVEGEADYAALPAGQALGPRAGFAAAGRGRWLSGHVRRRAVPAAGRDPGRPHLGGRPSDVRPGAGTGARAARPVSRAGRAAPARRRLASTPAYAQV